MMARVEIASTIFCSMEQLEAKRTQLMGKSVRAKYLKTHVGRVTHAWIQDGKLYAELDLDGLEIEMETARK